MIRILLVAVFALALGLFSRISFVRLVKLQLGDERGIGLVFVGQWKEKNLIAFQYPDFSGPYLLGEVIGSSELTTSRQIDVRVLSSRPLGERARIKLNTDLILGSLFWSKIDLKALSKANASSQSKSSLSD